MAIEDQLNQNIQLLNQTIAALNANMFGSPGGRPGLLGGNSRPGQGVNSAGDPHKDAIKLAAATTLLEKRMKENTDTMKYLVKNQTENMKNLNQYTAVAGKYFENTLQKFSAKQLDSEIPKQLTALLSNAINSGLIEPLKSYEAVLRLNKRVQTDNIDAAIRYTEQLNALETSTESTAEKVADVRDALEKTGWTVDDLNEALKKCGGSTDKLKEDMGKVSATMAEAAVNEERMSIASKAATKALTVLGSALVAGGALYLNTARSAAQYGTTFTNVIESAKNASLAGLNPGDLARLQHDQHQALNASNVSMETFQKQLVAGSWDLLQFTGNLGDGAKLTASFLGTFRSLSADTSKQDAFLKDQAQTFKTLNRTFSVTTEEFTSLNTMLMQSNDVQTSMYKLNQSQRVVAFKDLQQSYARLRSYGLLDEQAKKVTETLASLTGGKAQTRIEQAAKFQAVAGALGFGKEGAEAAAIIQRGARGQGDRARLAEITAKVQRGISGRVSGAYGGGVTAGLGTELSVDSLTSIISNLLGPEAATAALATSKGRQMTGAQQAALANTSFAGSSTFETDSLKHLMGIQDAVNTQGGNIVKTILLSAGAGALGGLVSKGAGGLLGKAVGGAGGLLGAGAATAGGMALGGTIAAGAAVAGGLLINKGVEMATGDSPGSWLYRGTHAFGTSPDQNYQTQLATAQAKRLSGRQTELVNKINEKESSLSGSPADREQIKQLEELKAAVDKLHGAFTAKDAPILQELNRLTRVTKTAADQSAAQTDEHINETRKQRKAKENTMPIPPNA